jgi:PAS domain S-box-containing protein
MTHHPLNPDATLATRTRELEAVRAIGAEITRELELAEVLRLISERLGGLVGYGRGGVCLWDAAAQLLIPHTKLNERERERFGLRLGQGVAGKVAESLQGVIVNDYRTRPGVPPEVLARTKVTAMMAEPLLYRDRLVGVIHMDTEKAGIAFTEQDHELLRLVAPQAAIAIENARLHEAAVRQGRELEALLAATRSVMSGLNLQEILDRIVVEATQISGCSHVKVLLVEPDGKWFRLGARQGITAHGFPFPVQGSLSGLVVATREPFYSPECAHDPRNGVAAEDGAHGIVTYLGLPIMRGDEVLGVLTFNTTAPKTYSPAEIAYLTAFADQAAIAIKNARLYAATQQELAERKRAEEALRESEERFKLSMEATSDGLWDWNVKTDGGYFSPGYYRMLGYEVGAFPAEGNAWMDLIHPDDRERALQANMDCIEGRRDLFEVEYRMKARNGEWRWILGRGKCIARDGQGRALRLVGTHVDITERKRAEVALRDRTAQLEAVRAVSAEFIRELDLDRLLTLLVQRVMRLLGVPTASIRLWEEASGLLMPLGWTAGASSEIVRLPFRLGEGVAGAAAQRRTGLLVNDFRTSPYATPALLAAPHTAALAEPLLYHDRLVGVISVDNGTTGRLFTPDDQALLRLFADQAAIAIENARLYTEATRSLQDLQKAQDALVQTEKLRALGQLAGGIAHDLNNKLMVILGQAEILRLTVAHPALAQGLAPLEEAATASAAVVRQVLDFGRQHASVAHTPIALAPVVEEALALTRAQWKDAAERQGASITIHTALADLPPVLGQAAELQKALVQVIGNAVEAMPTGGTLTLAGRVVDRWTGGVVDVREPIHPSTASPIHPVSSWVELTVTDTGVGIPAEIQPDLFDPFFTTKGVQRTGLGLAVVYGTLQRHGGTITVTSAPGQGTTFTLRLPAAPAAAPGPAAARPGGTPRRLLVIDDEPQVRETLAGLLRAAGHTVTEAASGPAGLALLGTIPVDCVLTDLGMPEMTGWEVAKAVTASWPNLPVLLLTGWGDQTADAPPGHRVARVLSKPIRREELLAVIAEVTGGR